MKDPRERLLQFKTNIDVVMSLLDRNGLGDWLADRLVDIGDSLRDDLPLRIQVDQDPFLDERLRVANLPAGAAEGEGDERGLRRGEGRARSRCSARRARSRARGEASRKSSSG